MTNELTESQTDRIAERSRARITQSFSERSDLSKEEKDKIIRDIVSEEKEKEISRIFSVEHLREELDKIHEQQKVEGEFEINEELIQ